MGEIIKRCGNCDEGYDWHAWNSLPLVGYQDEDAGPFVPGTEPYAETRNCTTCGSTMSIRCDAAWATAKVGMTGQEMADAERRFERKLPMGGTRMEPLDTSGKKDLWKDGD